MIVGEANWASEASLVAEQQQGLISSSNLEITIEDQTGDPNTQSDAFSSPISQKSRRNLELGSLAKPDHSTIMSSLETDFDIHQIPSAHDIAAQMVSYHRTFKKKKRKKMKSE